MVVVCSPFSSSSPKSVSLIARPAQFMSPFASKPRMVFVVPSSARITSESFLLILSVVVFAIRTLSTLSMPNTSRKSFSMFFILLPPPVSTIPPSNLSVSSFGMRYFTFSTISSMRASTTSMNRRLDTVLPSPMGSVALTSISSSLVIAEEYFNFIASALASSICNDSRSFVMFELPSGSTAMLRSLSR